ncbi:DNA polymerase [Psittacine adenovirus 2]|nr:DNA polymerase [Psittacine adenovirus 2]
MSYIYVTQNETPYRLNICKKNIKQTVIEICWTFNLFNCKKITKKSKCCEPFILISLNYQKSKTSLEIIKHLPVKKITIWKRLTGFITIHQEIKKNNANIELDFLEEGKELLWIRKWIKQQKCLSCGRIYATNHNCNFARSSFYYNKIASSKKYWEGINFQPIGEHKNTKKAFLIYDIETYTETDENGTNLYPLLLCFSIFGDEILTNIIHREIKKDSSLQEKDSVFFWFSKQKNFISRQFKLLRENILKELTSLFLKNILTSENMEVLTDLQKDKKLSSIYEINSSDEQVILCLKVNPIFIEFYVIGHNIQSFDEILLASQVLQTDLLPFQPFLNIQRNFMPRQGRILFNDITISFPYPEYFVNKKENKITKTEILEEEKKGSPSLFNTKSIYVKSMVRDTFQITHSSLKKAAEAYNLDFEKGCCPFKAVNEFFNFNSISTDEDSFPAEKYWTSKEEYIEQKNIWKSKKLQKYNIKEELISYCILDVKITQQLTETLLSTFNSFIKEEFNLNCNYNIFKRPTISSNSHAIFRQVLFKEKGTKIGKLPDLVAPSEEMYSFIRSSIRGGRCYPTFLGKYEKEVYIYDICGMYASALTHPLPFGIPVGKTEKEQEIEKFQRLLDTKEKISYFENIKPMIININAFPPPKEKLDCLPPLCSRKSGKLCWTNEPLKDEVITSIDAITLHNRGWNVFILKNELNTVFPMWETCCRNYVKANIQAKEKADRENNQVKRSISKLLSNALYGSFATKETNDMFVFEHSLTETMKEKIQNKELEITNISCLPTSSLPFTTHKNITFSQREKQEEQKRSLKEDEELNEPFDFEDDEEENIPSKNNRKNPAHKETYKPFNIIDVTPDCLTIYMLKNAKPHPENKRYPTQLASFVLAWTRTFTSEWSEILFSEEQHVSVEHKQIKAIYGDTDSLFLTKEGHHLMCTKGKHRIKSETSNLIYNDNEEITWAVECETKCKSCNSAAFSKESIFLAPKLYALKEVECTNCHFKKGGKLRAKGHAAEKITFELLEECFNYHKNLLKKERKFTTQRKALKRTLCKSFGTYEPFTIHEICLVRELRPWINPTLYFISENQLIPFDVLHPNPYIQNQLYEEFEDNES